MNQIRIMGLVDGTGGGVKEAVWAGKQVTTNQSHDFLFFAI